MITAKKQAALNQHLSLISAILDYFIERNSNQMVYDGYDPVLAIYQEQQAQAEKYYQEKKLDRLKYHLARLTQTLQNTGDFKVERYLKEKTGYELDIFGDLHRKVEAILAQKEIRNQKELGDIMKIHHYYTQQATDKKMVTQLETLIHQYRPKQIGKEKGHSKIISIIEKDGIEEIRGVTTTGPKPKLWEIEEISSPDGRCRIYLTRRSSSNYDSTSLGIQFSEASGTFYETNGIYPDIEACWKDNQNIVVKTKKKYLPNIQYSEFRSFDDIITITYVEI